MTDEELQRFHKMEGQIAAIGLMLTTLIEMQDDPHTAARSILSKWQQLRAHLMSTAAHVPHATLEAAAGFVQHAVAPVISRDSPNRDSDLTRS